MSNNRPIWRYLILAGALISAFGGWQIYAGQFNRSLGSEVLALGCVLVGLFLQMTSERGRN